MEVALIPPRGLEKFALQSKFHLTLPHLHKHKEYRETYQKAAARGDYIVLDNGEAEGEGIRGLTLCRTGDAFLAREIVVPDIIGDMQRTWAAVHDFFKVPNRPRFSHMAVVQGKSPAELHACVDVYSRNSEINVIGIPRHLLTSTGQQSVRIDLANWIADNYPERFQIHLLGTNPVWVTEVKYAYKYACHIRSVDTSMPFNYALAGKLLREDTKDIITRPENYFVTDYSKMAKAIVMDNIQKLLEWAGV